MKVFLSYPLTPDTPSFGNATDHCRIRPEKEIQKRDSCNTEFLTLHSHIGTHVDAPYHFFSNGRQISDFSADFWHFSVVECIHITEWQHPWIDLRDRKKDLAPDLEMLLIKTGMGEKRGTSAYWQNNPGITAASGKWLRRNFPVLRAVGFDFISISPWEDRSGGRKAHRFFLDPDTDGNPILIIEDMALASIKPHTIIESVTSLPLRIADVGGAPVTVIADIA